MVRAATTYYSGPRLDVADLDHFAGVHKVPLGRGLSAWAELRALWAYSTAVAERTRELVRGLRPEALDGPVEPGHQRWVLFDEGVLRPAHDWRTPCPSR